MPSVSVNGVELSFEKYGIGAIPMVFVHGYSGRASVYQRLYDALWNDFTIYALDLRSHGGSKAIDRDCTTRQWVDDIVAFSAALGVEQPVFAGHSLGGALGLAAAIQQRDAFRAVCLLCTLPAAGGITVPADLVTAILNAHGNRPVMRENYRGMFVHGPSDTEIDVYVDAACEVPAAPYRLYQTREMVQFNVADSLGDITVPVLVLSGALDSVCPPAEQHKTAMGLRKYKEVSFSDEGHMLPIERPVRTAREIIGFVRGISDDA
ncbi:MAG: alpha/beta fold hydrolase [Dehalococcoidia bacterium]